MTDGLKAKHRAAIIAVLATNERVERAVLFGSRAMGTNTVTSDIDIALFGRYLTLTDQAKLMAACDELPMAQSVDLVLYNTIDNTTLVKHICNCGVEWYRRVGVGNVTCLKLTESHRALLTTLLQEHLPNVEAWICGSSLNGEHYDVAKLSLVLRGLALEQIPADQLGSFEDAVQRSTIPFLVEARDWTCLSEQFHQEIERKNVVLLATENQRNDNQNNNIVHTKLRNCVNLIRDTIQPSCVPNIPYIGLEHIGEGSLHLVGQGISNDIESIKNRFQAGDTLFGKLRPYFRKVARAPFDGICSTDIWVVRSKNGIDQRFIHYCLASQHFIDFVNSRSEGTRMPRANWECASEYKINLPSLPEQCAIAHILSTLDDKIELNHRMIKTLEAMAEAIFKDWFVDFGPVKAKMEGRKPYLPSKIWGLFPDSFEDLELREIPRGWKVKPLSEIASFLNGLALQKYPAQKSEDSLPVIKIAELRNGISAKTSKASRNIPHQYIVTDGDFLFSWSGSLMAAFWTEGEGALNQHLFKVTSDQYPSWFFAEWVRFYLKEFQNIAASKATTMGHIQRSHLQTAATNCPPDAVITGLSPCIEPLVKRAILARLESYSLAKIRDLLLPKLISRKLEIQSMECI